MSIDSDTTKQALVGFQKPERPIGASDQIGRTVVDPWQLKLHDMPIKGNTANTPNHLSEPQGAIRANCDAIGIATDRILRVLWKGELGHRSCRGEACDLISTWLREP